LANGLTNQGHFLVELRAVLEGKERALDGRNGGREIEVGSLGVGLTNLEAVLKNAVDDATNTERGLNNVGNVLLFLYSLGLL
jgi:hypothetical protein